MLHIHKSWVFAEIMKWGICQNPFTDQLPRKSEIILHKLDALFPDVMIQIEDIRSFVSGLIDSISEIREWNLSQVEYEQGIEVDDPHRAPFAFTSSYTTIKPEHDFIDIDALKQNVTRALEKERQEREETLADL